MQADVQSTGGVAAALHVRPLDERGLSAPDELSAGRARLVAQALALPLDYHLPSPATRLHPIHRQGICLARRCSGGERERFDGEAGRGGDGDGEWGGGRQVEVAARGRAHDARQEPGTRARSLHLLSNT